MLIFTMFGTTAAITCFVCAMVYGASLTLVNLSIFASGLFSQPMFNVLLIILNEITTRTLFYEVTAFPYLVESIAVILTGVFFAQFKNCAVFYTVWIGWLFCASIACTLSISETPHFLFKKRRF